MLSNDTKATIFALTDKRLYVPVVALSTQHNAKLLEQLKSGFKRTVNWNKHDPKVSVQAPNPYLDFLINPSFQGVNRLFVLLFENKDDRTVHTKYYLVTVKIEDYNVMIDGRNFFYQPLGNNLATYDNIRKTTIGQGDDYTTGCLLDYNYFNNYYKMVETGLSKQPALDADPEAIQLISFTRTLNWSEDKNDNTISVGEIVMPCAFRVKSNFFVFSKLFWHKIWEKKVPNVFLIFVNFTDQNMELLKIMLFLTKVYSFCDTKRLIWSI